jgi:hypothetical protein
MTSELLNPVKRFAGLKSTSHRSMSKVMRCQRPPEVRFLPNGRHHSRSLEPVNTGEKQAFRVSLKHFLKKPQGCRRDRHEVTSSTL